MGWLTGLWRRRGSRRRGFPGPVDPTVSALTETRQAWWRSFHSITGGDRLNKDFWKGLEQALVATDMGLGISTELVEAVRRGRPDDPTEARDLLQEEMLGVFAARDRGLALTSDDSPAVVMVVGVNGAGKTTTSAKIAHLLVSEGRTCLLGASDTYRPAAQDQLRIWADVIGVDMVGGKEGADPAAVARDAWAATKNRGHQVAVIDTAGRLHSKTHLMDQLQKIKRVLVKAGGNVNELLLVLDASTGQNGLAQAQQFCDRVGVTGVVLTKLDGTARGGVALAVECRLGIPIKLVGTGEALSDLHRFSPERFVGALMGEGSP